MVKEKLLEKDRVVLTQSSGGERQTIFAPCRSDGNVNTVDNDTKEAICLCHFVPKGCLVDNRNHIVGKIES